MTKRFLTKRFLLLTLVFIVFSVGDSFPRKSVCVNRRWLTDNGKVKIREVDIESSKSAKAVSLRDVSVCDTLKYFVKNLPNTLNNTKKILCYKSETEKDRMFAYFLSGGGIFTVSTLILLLNSGCMISEIATAFLFSPEYRKLFLRVFKEFITLHPTRGFRVIKELVKKYPAISAVLGVQTLIGAVSLPVSIISFLVGAYGFAGIGIIENTI